MILDPAKEKVRYYLVFATNSLHGLDVFKNAERDAANIQDDVRYTTHVRKTGPTLPGLFDDGAPPSRLVVRLKERYSKLAKQKIREILLTKQETNGTGYEELFAAALEFPLVGQGDLDEWIEMLGPAVRLRLTGSKGRHKPALFKGDRVVVVDKNVVARWS